MRRTTMGWVVTALVLAACGAPRNGDPPAKPAPVYTANWWMCSQDHVAATPPGVEVVTAPRMLRPEIVDYVGVDAYDTASCLDLAGEDHGAALVLVDALVEIDGTIGWTQICRSVDACRDSIAVDAARRTTLQTATVDGQPVRTVITLPFHFPTE